MSGHLTIARNWLRDYVLKSEPPYGVVDALATILAQRDYHRDEARGLLGALNRKEAERRAHRNAMQAWADDYAVRRPSMPTERDAALWKACTEEFSMRVPLIPRRDDEEVYIYRLGERVRVVGVGVEGDGRVAKEDSPLHSFVTVALKGQHLPALLRRADVFSLEYDPPESKMAHALRNISRNVVDESFPREMIRNIAENTLEQLGHKTCEPSDQKPSESSEAPDDGSGSTANADLPSPPAEARKSRGAISSNDAALGIDDHATAGMIEYLVRVIAEHVPIAETDDPAEDSANAMLARNIREAKKRAKWLRERAERAYASGRHSPGRKMTMYREFKIFGKDATVSTSSLAEDFKRGIHARARIAIDGIIQARAECHLPGTSWGVQLHFRKDEDPIGWMVGFGLATVYGSLDSKPIRRLAKFVADTLVPGDMDSKWSGRDFGIRFFDSAVWWDLGSDDYGWTSGRPKWKDGSWHPVGRKMRTSEPVVLETREVLVPMPERSYRGTATMTEALWGYTKLPSFFHEKHRSVTIEMHEGEQIGVPGKGENGWDCGDDAIFSRGGREDSIEDAIGGLVASALRTRKKHGWSYAPSESNGLGEEDK